MKFLIEKNQNEDHRVTITIPESIIHKKIVKKFVEISKKENINGFRKGKVPIQIIQKKYGKNVYYDIFNILMQKFFYKFINEKKLKIIGSPQYYIHKNQVSEKKDFQYSVRYELEPYYTLQDIKLITVKKIIVNITDQDIKKHIEKSTQYKTFWKPTNKPIKINDRIFINYTVYIKNKIIHEFNQKNLSFIIAKNVFIPELFYKIINRYTNDVFFFTKNFSKFHPEKRLKNQEVTCKIKIINIERIETEEILQPSSQKNNQNNRIQTHFQEIKKQINKKINDLSDNFLYSQIMQKLIKKNPLVIPPLVLEEEIKNLYHKNTQKYQNKKGNILENKYHVNLASKAKKNLHINLIIKKIIHEYKLSPNTRKTEALIKKISLNYHKPSEIINLYNTDSSLIEKIQNLELETQVIQILLKNINIIKEYYTLDEAMNYNWSKNNHYLKNI